MSGSINHRSVLRPVMQAALTRAVMTCAPMSYALDSLIA